MLFCFEASVFSYDLIFRILLSTSTVFKSNLLDNGLSTHVIRAKSSEYSLVLLISVYLEKGLNGLNYLTFITPNLEILSQILLAANFKFIRMMGLFLDINNGSSLLALHFASS